MFTIVISILFISFMNLINVIGQDTGEVKVYRTQFDELRGKVTIMLGHVERMSRSGMGEREKIDMLHEILALTKLIYRLGEESQRSNVHINERGLNSNKTLLLITTGCSSLIT
jgi:hypothetical protein